MDKGIVYVEQLLKCSSCNYEVKRCYKCEKLFHVNDSIYCELYNAVDDSYYVHLCKDCAVKEGKLAK